MSLVAVMAGPTHIGSDTINNRDSSYSSFSGQFPTETEILNDSIN